MNGTIGFLGKIAYTVSTTQNLHENDAVTSLRWPCKNKKGKRRTSLYSAPRILTPEAIQPKKYGNAPSAQLVAITEIQYQKLTGVGEHIWFYQLRHLLQHYPWQQGREGTPGLEMTWGFSLLGCRTVSF